ncbi:hypothetical protein [Priestia flexa]|nr:hypothetical protein [Priestia flexa]
MNKKVLAGIGISFALLLSPLQQASAAKNDVDAIITDYPDFVQK